MNKPNRFSNAIPELQNSKIVKLQKSEASEPKKVGRPKAKHSDRENYHQTTVYIHRQIFNDAKVRLLKQGGGDMSSLIEHLLQGWLKT